MNYTIRQALERLEPFIKDLPFSEQQQLRGLIQDHGYLGALEYLDPNKKYPWSSRDQRMVESHFKILKSL